MKPASNWKNIRITARHWHYAVVALLCLVSLVLAVQLVYAWRSAQAGSAENLAQRQTEFKAMQLKTRPLRGLDKKIGQAQVDEQAFYDKRFPATYSAVLTELGKLAVQNNVLLANEQYAQGKRDQGLYEIRMNANVTGDYAPIVRFINGLERDRIFFLINGIALSGQQSGIVSLRMRLTTYLRAPVGTAGSPTAADNTSSMAADNASSPEQP
jgi:Tfp pilus assembly protein PilO